MTNHPGTPIRVVIVDDQELVRRGFAALIAAEEGYDVVGEAADGAQAVSIISSTKPDVVLMDVRMPVMGGIEATRQIVADPHNDRTRVVILTTFDLDEYVYDALRAGASGFVLKDVPPNELLAAIRVVAGGDALISPGVTRRLIAEFAARPDAAAGAEALALLTDREREVLAEVGRGRNNAEVGDVLNMSPLTAKTHVSRIMSKLYARDRSQLVVAAYESGLIRPGED